MTSFFDEIFQLSGDAPVNPLFSSNNKFRSAKVAESLTSVKPPVKGDHCGQRTADIPAPVKDKKAGRKRKAAEPAAPQQATETGHKRSKMVASSHTKQNLSTSETQSNQDTPTPPPQPQLGKRKRQNVNPNNVIQPSLAAVTNTIDDVKAMSEDAPAAVHETATQVHIASKELVFCFPHAASCEHTVFLL